MNRIFRLLFLLIFIISKLSGQTLWLTPSHPKPNDTVTLTFNAKGGNEALKNFKGDVYLHAGIITANSLDNHDWKNVIGNWGKADPHVKMKKVTKNIYTFKFVINRFYHLTPKIKVHQLTFVFRNKDGSIVAKDKNGNDFLLPIFGYHKPLIKKAKYLFQKRIFKSFYVNSNTLTVKTNYGLLQIIPYNNKIVEIRNFSQETPIYDSSVAVIMHKTSIKKTLKSNDVWLQWNTDSLHILIHKNPVFVVFTYNGDTLLSEKNGYFERSDNNGLQFKMQENERYYGLGERAINILRGHRFQLYNQAHYGYEIGAQNLNYSVPMLLSNKKYLLFFDNPEKGYIDLGKSRKNIMEWGAIGGVMKYFFIAGYNFTDLYNQYGKLTGTQPLPPRWALGNLQSRMAYRTQYETDSIVKLMQQRDFPIDAIILDFYWFGDSIKGTMGRLAWYKPHWPHPKSMISNFKKRGVKTVLITEPYILDTLKNFRIGDSLGIFTTDSTGKTYINNEFYFGNGALIDIFKPIARKWFWKQYQKQIKIGVAGWWGDLGEPESHPSDMYHINGKAYQVHNIYAHIWHKMLFNNYRKYYPNTRLFNLNRAGYAGSQRFSIFPWTGDVSRSWRGLQAQLPLLIHMSLSGLPFIHSDAGGFAQGKKDNELYTRWLQLACFSPILRPHGSDIPSEPIFFNDTTQRIVRRFMKERYRLLPYIYTAAWKTHTKGTPIVRPLFFDFPYDSITYTVFDEYLWGNDFLIAPIVKKNQVKRKIYLPSGYWYNWWNNQIYKGGDFITLSVNIETIPVFVKAGSFIPIVPAVNSTDNYSSKNLTILFYKNPVKSYNTDIMYEDDGKTYEAYKKGNYQLLHFKTNDNKHFIFVQKSGNLNIKPAERKVTLKIISEKNIKTKRFLLKQNEIKHIDF